METKNLRTILAEEGMVTKEGTLDDDSLSRLLDPEAVGEYPRK